MRGAAKAELRSCVQKCYQRTIVVLVIDFPNHNNGDRHRLMSYINSPSQKILVVVIFGTCCHLTCSPKSLQLV